MQGWGACSFSLYMKSSLCSFLFAALLLGAGAAFRVNGQIDPSTNPAERAVQDQIVSFANQGEIPMGLELADRSIAAHPEWTSILLMRATLHKFSKQPDKMMADYADYLRKTP